MDWQDTWTFTTIVFAPHHRFIGRPCSMSCMKFGPLCSQPWRGDRQMPRSSTAKSGSSDGSSSHISSSCDAFCCAFLWTFFVKLWHESAARATGKHHIAKFSTMEGANCSCSSQHFGRRVSPCRLVLLPASNCVTVRRRLQALHNAKAMRRSNSRPRRCRGHQFRATAPADVEAESVSTSGKLLVHIVEMYPIEGNFWDTLIC